jgi:tripartite-type tricarboxylate transporter receptor subunit TctC
MREPHFLHALTACAVLGAALPLPLPAAAGDYPTRPITLIVPFAPGGTTDIVAREVGQKLVEALKQPVLIDNRPGAGGTAGAASAAKATPDGYTFFMATVAHTMAPGIYKSLPYDFTSDLDPVGLVASTPNVLIVNPSIPVQSVAELIAYIKAHPGKVNYGSAGIGSTEHLCGEMFGAMTGTALTHIPYKGGAPMMTDLMSGQIQMAIETSPSAEPQIRAGKVKALAVTTPNRSAAYPSVPTMDEAGVKGFDVTTWYALMAPHGTPAAIVNRMNTELARALKQPDIVRQFGEQGVTAGRMSPEQLAAFIKAETSKWGKVVKDSGIVPE